MAASSCSKLFWLCHFPKNHASGRSLMIATESYLCFHTQSIASMKWIICDFSVPSFGAGKYEIAKKILEVKGKIRLSWLKLTKKCLTWIIFVKSRFFKNLNFRAKIFFFFQNLLVFSCSRRLWHFRSNCRKHGNHQTIKLLWIWYGWNGNWRIWLYWHSRRGHRN